MRVCRTAIVCLWAVMISWLIRYEAFPEKFTTSLDGYRSLIPKDVFFTDSWMKITFRGLPVGLSHTSIDSDDTSITRRYSVNNRTDIKFKLVGRQQTLTVNSVVDLDSVFHLQQFAVSAATAGQSIHVDASRNRENRFEMTIRSPGATNSMVVEIPSDAVIYSPLSSAALKHMEPGQQVKIAAFDPLAMRNIETVVRATRKEFVRVQNKRQEATVLEARYRNLKVTTWIDTSGNVLRQELPFDWAMEKCSTEEALSALRDSDGGADLFSVISGNFFGWGNADD